MHLLYKGKKYNCKCNITSDISLYGIPSSLDFPIVGEFSVCADDGFVIKTANAEDWLRQTFENGVLVLTNEPEKEPVVEEPIEDGYSETDDTAAMLVDHEYRLTMLELGLV